MKQRLSAISNRLQDRRPYLALVKTGDQAEWWLGGWAINEYRRLPTDIVPACPDLVWPRAPDTAPRPVEGVDDTPVSVLRLERNAPQVMLRDGQEHNLWSQCPEQQMPEGAAIGLKG